MRIAILSRNPDLYSTSRLREACEQRGHSAVVMDTLAFSIHVEQGHPKLFYLNEPVDNIDAVVPRIGASITFFGAALVRQFEQIGVPCLNSSNAIVTSRDKLRAMQIMSRHSVSFPTTVFVREKEAILPAIESVGGAPVVIKLLEGTQGVGVILAETIKVAEAIVETLQSARQNVLIQKFISESRGKDVRAIVVGGQVVAAMRRVAQGDEFRSNVHRGGRTEPVQLDSHYMTAATNAAQILGLNVAGVDMLETSQGPMVIEVNSSPGLEGIERATGIDVASEMIAFLENQVLFPEIDIRQRLTLKSGYGVAEVPIGANSALLGRVLRDAGLRERDVLVMSITRGSVTIPNPKGEEELKPGDRLLCFGRLETLKAFLPPKKDRRKTHQEKSSHS